MAQLVKRLILHQVMISRVCEFEPHLGLCADSSEPGTCFGFCVCVSLCPSPAHTLCFSKLNKCRGAWVAQSVKRPTSAQVMISHCEISHDLLICADSSEPGACFRFCVCVSLCPSPVHALSLLVSKINKNIYK